jgi:hypothetical protein
MGAAAHSLSFVCLTWRNIHNHSLQIEIYIISPHRTREKKQMGFMILAINWAINF